MPPDEFLRKAEFDAQVSKMLKDPDTFLTFLAGQVWEIRRICESRETCQSVQSMMFTRRQLAGAGSIVGALTVIIASVFQVVLRLLG